MPRPDLDVNARCSQLFSGHTPLLMAIDKNDFGSQDKECVNMLLSDPNVDVNVRDGSGTVTPLFLAAKHGNETVAKQLIENGARLDAKIRTKLVRDLVASKLPGLAIDTIRVKKWPRVDSEVALDQILAVVKSVQLGDKDYVQKFIQFRQLCQAVTASPAAAQQRQLDQLAEKCCRKGLAEFAQQLFNRGLSNPNCFPDGSMSAPVLDAAERGDLRMLQVLRRCGADFFKPTKQVAQETVLHCLLARKGLQKSVEIDRFNKCLHLILDKDDNADEEFRRGLQRIINKRDMNGCTALHYATEKWDDDAVRLLLQKGANIGAKNDWEELPISRISPELLDNFLSEDCMSYEGDLQDRDLEITFKYHFLAPDPETLPDSYKVNLDEEEIEVVDEKRTRSKLEAEALPETETLWYMGQSKRHRHLLKHPVISSFIWYKWERMRPIFNRNLRLYLLFVFLLTWYIFTSFGGRSQQDSIRSWFYILYIIGIPLNCLFVIKDWIRNIQDLSRYYDHLDGKSQCFEMCKSNWWDLLHIGGMVVVLFCVDHLWIPIIVLLALLAAREVLQMLVSLKRYLTSIENWIELVMIVLGFIIVFTDNPESYMTNRHLAAVALVLSWTEFITLVGHHPKLLKLNVYVRMFYTVLNSFILFLLWYSLFIIAFGCGFYIMLHDDTVPENLAGLEDDDKNPLFNRTWLSLVKTSAMFVGELEFSDLPINSQTYLGMLAYVFFLAFLFLIVVVLMNLLNGLAVSDTGEIKAKAEIYSYMSRVETISYMESTLLGDPFDFLSNVPKFVANWPSVSLIRQCYRSSFCRKVMRKVGANGFLLFYNFLPDKTVKIKPNINNKCCTLASDELGRDILQSAKEILRQKDKDALASTTTSAASDDLNEVKARLKQLEDIYTKLEKFMKTKY